MSTNQADIQSAVTRALHEHWKLYLTEGIVLVALGLIIRQIASFESPPYIYFQY